MNGIQLISISKINITLYANDQVLLSDSEKELQITAHHLKTTWSSLPRKINKFECAKILSKYYKLCRKIARVTEI
jgi:hypothetical protein